MAVFADPFGAGLDGQRQRVADDNTYNQFLRMVEADQNATRDRNRAIDSQERVAQNALGERARQFDQSFGENVRQFNTTDARLRERDAPLPNPAPGQLVAGAPTPPRRPAPPAGSGVAAPPLAAVPPPTVTAPSLRTAPEAAPAVGDPFAAPTPPLFSPEVQQQLDADTAGATFTGGNPFGPEAPPVTVPREPRARNSDGSPYQGFSFREWLATRPPYQLPPADPRARNPFQ